MSLSSSTQAIPADPARLRHLAVIMDGNGRWAKKRFLPRVAGHKKGLDAVRSMVSACLERRIDYLTLFAFSSENWRRPADEVSFLMSLFIRALNNEVRELHQHGVRLRVLGDLSAFSEALRQAIVEAESLTAANTALNLTICANYGGRWDILQAANQLAKAAPEKAGQWSEAELAPYLSMSFAPEPDLFIRTGGEQRVSNFLLWQLAYTELYFTDTLWPDFHKPQLGEAIDWFARRERRFGRISEQLDTKKTGETA
ncbi:MAG TPA: polyprenyl diphosphate synthase [Rhodocyclaceae bacterium]|nr:polyprenyl diphosphate synthase [Rhodocyclaceae bacterium]